MESVEGFSTRRLRLMTTEAEVPSRCLREENQAGFCIFFLYLCVCVCLSVGECSVSSTCTWMCVSASVGDWWRERGNNWGLDPD